MGKRNRKNGGGGKGKGNKKPKIIYKNFKTNRLDSDSNGIKTSIKKGERALLEAQAKFVDTDEAISDGTVDTYADVYASFLRKANEAFGYSDITKMTNKHTNRLFNKMIDNGFSPSTINNYRHALHKVQKAMHTTGQLKEDKVFYEHKDTKDIVVEKNVKRSYKAVKEECDKVLDVMKEKSEVRKNGEVVGTKDKAKKYYEISKTQMLLGGRISEILRMKPEHIDLENNRVKFINAKGGLDNTVWIDHLSTEDKYFLRELKER